ncbi:unnamed protein product [Paramecium pentaurelia]|uniref:Uncharacterized protein n=1 Tax=Paramecium pentaurelia TaxID=43138 RepID=A0A8S1X3R2_9CILI|nr:unnamed protein product [Paramecium pentaurelia]
MQFKPAPSNLNQIRAQKVKFDDKELTFLKKEKKLEQRITELMQELQQIPKLQEQIKTLNEQIQKQESTIQRFRLAQSNERTLNERIQNKEITIQNQEHEIEQLNKKIDQLQKDVCYEKQNKQITYQIKQPVKSLTVQQEQEKPIRVQELEKQLLYKTSAVLKVQEKKRQMKKQFKNRIEQLEQELKDYKYGYETYYEQNEQLTEQLRDASALCGQLTSENQSLKDQLELFKCVPSEERDKNQDTKYIIEIQNLRNRNLQQQQQISQLQYDISELKTQNGILIEKLKTIDSVKQKNDKLQGELMLLETENERLKRKNLSDLDHIEQQIVQISLKEQQIKDKNYELELKQINLHQMIKYTNGMKEENEQLNAEIVILKSQIIDLRRQFEFVEEKHEEEMRILEEKLKLQQTQTNFRIINQIPVQINSPYQIPQIERHYL